MGVLVCLVLVAVARKPARSTRGPDGRPRPIAGYITTSPSACRVDRPANSPCGFIGLFFGVLSRLSYVGIFLSPPRRWSPFRVRSHHVHLTFIGAGIGKQGVGGFFIATILPPCADGVPVELLFAVTLTLRLPV